ncbi:MAG: GAF domain-containing protein [Steroidobacteraceae bacterium]|jgi:diguanylate cyclase (GGDEF)-like protein/PAS domain S-box-containing protein
MNSAASSHPVMTSATEALSDPGREALRVSESRYRRLFETARDGILLLNADTAQIEDVNPYLIEMLGYSHEEFLGRKLWEVGAFADRAESKEMFAVLQTTGYVRYEDLPLKTKAGTNIQVEFVSNTYECEGIKVVQCNIRNISDRKIAEAKLQRYTQLYAALSECNEAIVHCVSEEELFLQVCRAAVQFGGMKMAWVGFVDTETLRVRPAASCGDDIEYLKDIDISVDVDSPFGRGPTGTAFRENRPHWCQDILNDPATLPWRERAARAGLAASASLPLRRKGIVVGTFTLYSGEVESFDESARDLLVKMAADISFALDHFAHQSQRRRTEEEIQFKNTILKTQQETSLDAILVVDENGKIISYNQRFIDLWRLSPELVSARVDAPVLQSVVAQVENPEAFASRVQYLTAHRDDTSHEEVALKDGRTIDRYSAPVTGADRKYYGRVWYFRDITQRKEAEHRIAYLNRVYAVLSSINTLIVHVRDRIQLFKDACHIAVAQGGFRMSLIAMVDQSANKIVPVAAASKDKELMIAIKAILSSSENAADTMIPRAIRENKLIVSNDSRNDPAVLFGKKYAKSGVRSIAIFPLMRSRKAMGVLALYASESEFFHEEELKLLAELAGEISFALENISRQEKLAMLARIRAVSSAISAAIIRIHDREALFKEACRIAVEVGAFRMAWIGVVEPKTLEGKIVAWYGGEDGFVDNIRLTARDGTPDSERPACRALRQLQPVLCNDIATDPSVSRFRDELLRGGHKSVGCFPLTVLGRPAAVIALFAGEAHAFDDEETGLLLDLSANISFALENIDGQQKLVNLARIRAVSGEINAAILRIHDRDELFREVCRIAVVAGGFSLAWVAVVDRDVMQLRPVAWEGLGRDYIERIPLSLNAADMEKFGLAGRAVCEKKPMIVDDMQQDPRVVLRADSRERGLQSLVTLPLLVSDTVVGVLVLYAKEIGFFDESEMKLLLEVAANISFALDHIEKAEKLDYLAYYDALTGLANRSLFLERLAQYMRSAGSAGHKLSLFLIDLERFKNINDSLGRPAGDALLRQVARWLTLNAGDAGLLARVGTDHFAVVLPVVKRDGDVVRLLEKTMAAFLGHPFRLNDAVLRVSAKVGVALFPDDGADADTLFMNAEAALKKAKASGEPYLFHTQKMTEMIAGKLTLENQLRQALDNEEFVLHYQPKVNLTSGKLTGAEALIRWNDPRTGLVPPGRFIPILEETGLIHDVGRWALRQAIEDYLRWRRAGLAAVRIAVNVSPLQLRHRGFIDEIKQAISIDAQAAAGLELEITESVIMEDIKGNIASLQAIRALGVTIAIDDFGTGFSSLSYLAKLPVDTLKIDRSFVVDMTVASEGLALVSTIIILAHSLKLKVVVEGVETEEQSRLLRLVNCDEMQGFLFSRPVPAEIFETRFLAPPPAA